MTVFLGNIAGVDSGTIGNVQTTLAGYFTQVVAGTSTTFSGVQIVTTAPSATAGDVLVYIVSRFSNSALKKWNPNIQGGGNAGNTVFTNDQKTSGSEVYVDVITAAATNLAAAMANLIFHECMHFITATGDALHQGADGLAKEVVSANDTLTSGNIATLQAALPKAVTPWVGGF